MTTNSRSVSIDFPYLTIGGCPDEPDQEAYLYESIGNDWELVEEFMPFIDGVAYASDVAVCGNQVIVSDTRTDENPNNAGTEGTAYFYAAQPEYDGKPWGQFTIINFEAGNQLADFMFSNSENPYTPNFIPNNNVYAYETLQWGLIEGGGRHQTEARLNRSDSALLDGLDPDLVDFQIEGFSLSSLNKINTVDLGTTWDDIVIPGAGDNRYYDGGNGQISYNGLVKLQWENMMFNFTVPYSFQQALEDPPQRIGSGGSITGYGQATLITGNCDAAWLTEFDPNGTGQLRFDIETFSLVQQGDWGYYTAEITINPVDFIQTYAREDIPNEGININLPVEFNNAGIDFLFQDINFGENDGDDLIVNFIDQEPDATGLEDLFIADGYWQFGSTFDSFNTSVTFDVDMIGNFPSNQGVSVYRREMFGDDWEQWNDIELIGETQIKALNVSQFSDWLLTSEDDPLPVELSAFFAVQNTDNLAQINWVTQSEQNLIGFHIFRNSEDNINTSFRINTKLIAAHNTSQTQNYDFTDTDVELEQTYFYWLESVELDGLTTFFGPVSITLFSDENEDENAPDIIYQTGIKSIYPNPFNPSCVISYYLREKADVTIDIFNAKGQKIYQIKEGIKEPEIIHSVRWNGENSISQNIGSGVIFFKLSAGKTVEIQKALLLK